VQNAPARMPEIKLHTAHTGSMLCIRLSLLRATYRGGGSESVFRRPTLLPTSCFILASSSPLLYLKEQKHLERCKQEEPPWFFETKTLPAFFMRWMMYLVSLGEPANRGGGGNARSSHVCASVSPTQQSHVTVIYPANMTPCITHDAPKRTASVLFV